MCAFPETASRTLHTEDGSLPEERVSTSLPFVHIGTDFAGPLYVKEGSSVKEEYVCVFTCASSCMVHLELTNGVTTDEFLQAFSRMTNRRGLCHTVWSDNAKTFKAASREIKKLHDQPKSQSQSLWDTLDQDRIKSELSAKGLGGDSSQNARHGEVDGENDFVEQLRNHCAKFLEEHFSPSTR